MSIQNLSFYLVYGDGALRLTPRGEGDAMASPGGPALSPRMSPRIIPSGSQSAPAGLSLAAVRQQTSPVSSPRRVAIPPLLGSNSSYAGAFGYMDPSAAGVMSVNAPTTPSPRNPTGLPRSYSPAPTLNVPMTPTASSTPCSTLYIKNLAPTTTEQDSLNLFRTQAGFRKLKLQAKPSGALMLFVEFADASFSTQAMQTLQGAILCNAPIRIEYARHKMGESSANLLLSSSSGTIVPSSPRSYPQTLPVNTDHTHSPRTQQNGNGSNALSTSPSGSASQASAAGSGAGVPQQQAGMFVVHPSNQHYNM